MRLKRRPPPTPPVDGAVTLRHAGPHDREALEQLAGRDTAAALRGDVLLALVDDRPWAALDLADGRIVADPFRPTAHLADLLRLHAGNLRAGGRVPRGLVLPALPRALPRRGALGGVGSATQ